MIWLNDINLDRTDLLVQLYKYSVGIGMWKVNGGFLTLCFGMKMNQTNRSWERTRTIVLSTIKKKSELKNQNAPKTWKKLSYEIYTKKKQGTALTENK